jgi:hypothetical protein
LWIFFLKSQNVFFRLITPIFFFHFGKISHPKTTMVVGVDWNLKASFRVFFFPLFSFFFQFYDIAKLGIISKKIYTNFRYMPDVKIENFNNHFAFWLLTRTCCRNLVILFLFLKKIWWIRAIFLKIHFFLFFWKHIFQVNLTTTIKTIIFHHYYNPWYDNTIIIVGVVIIIVYIASSLKRNTFSRTLTT